MNPASAEGRQPRFALLEQFSGRNIGDSISLHCLIERIRKRLPDAAFDVYSYKGGDLAYRGDRRNVRFVDIGLRSLSLNYVGLPLLRRLPEADFVVTRGGRFFSNKLFHPYYNHMLNFCLVFPFARMLGKPILLFDIGIGPLRSKLSRLMAKFTLSSAAMITLRDAEALNWLYALKLRAPYQALAADPVWLYDPPPTPGVEEELSRLALPLERGYVVVNVTPLTASFVGRPISAPHLERSLSALLRGPLADRKVLLFPTQVSDLPFCRALAESRDGVSVVLSHELSFSALFMLLKRAELTIGMRYHSVILAMLAGCPTLAIGYAPKVVALMRETGLQECCFSGVEFDRLGEAAADALSNPAKLGELQRTRVAALKDLARNSDVCFDEFISTWRRDGKIESSA